MFKIVGNYLERNVVYEGISSLEKYSSTPLSKSVVLVCFNNANISDQELEIFFKNIIQEEPLSITFYGISGDKHFEKLLEMLSILPKKKHIMTYVSKSENCLDDFFLASWPAEERHGDWENYMILEIGGSSLGQLLKTYLQK